jgi:hypothetical protein
MVQKRSDLADLAIIVPPSFSDSKQSLEYRHVLKKIMDAIYQNMRPGGVCCLILSGGMSEFHDRVAMADVGSLSLFERSWIQREEIIWARDSKKAESESEFEILSLEEIPFSHIFVLERHGSKTEFVPRSERTSLAGLSRKKREEIEDSIWHVPPKFGGSVRDRIPREIAVRIILSYSNPGETVLDPFVKNGTIRDVSKGLGRAFRFVTAKQKAIK